MPKRVTAVNSSGLAQSEDADQTQPAWREDC